MMYDENNYDIAPIILKLFLGMTSVVLKTSLIYLRPRNTIKTILQR